jgi:hypothetical protein
LHMWIKVGSPDYFAHEKGSYKPSLKTLYSFHTTRAYLLCMRSTCKLWGPTPKRHAKNTFKMKWTHTYLNTQKTCKKHI